MARGSWLAISLGWPLLLGAASGQGAQTPTVPGASSPNLDPPGSVLSATAHLPDARALLLDVERNDKRLEALRRDYTYHVHMRQEQLNKDGSAKKTEITDSESLTINGVRVNRVVARNGIALTPGEQEKENERVDKDVARARERVAKAAGKGEETDDRGDTVLSAGRILELGRFSNERRVLWHGRPTIVLDYAGDPGAKTHSAVENVVKDLVGTVWIDEADHVLVRGEGHFLNDFKIGGGLLADVRKGSSFDFEATRVEDGAWLPATINGQGSVRVLLLAGFNGRMNVATSDYKRFRTSSRILPGESKVDSQGNPIPTLSSPGPVAPPADSAPKPQR